MSDQQQHVPIGTGHASAMLRLGLKELRELGSFQGSNVAQPGELGLYGTATPGEVADARKASGPEVEKDRDSDRSLADRVKEAETRESESRDDRDLERE